MNLKPSEPAIRAQPLSPRVALAAGAGVLVLGAVVLGGWMFELEALKHLVPGGSTMKANTALCFILTGTALLLLRGPSPGRGKTTAAQISAGAVMMIGGVTLGEYLWGADLGITEWFSKSLHPDAIESRSRMVAAAALDFVFLGAALLLLHRGWHRLVLGLVFTAGGLAYLSLVGCLFDTLDYHPLDSMMAMAMATALGFLLLCAGVMAACRDARLSDLIQNPSANVFIRRLLPAALGLPLILGWLRLKGQQGGLFGIELGIELLIVANTAIIIALIGWSARTILRLDTEREHSEQAKAVSEQRFQAIAESASEAIIQADHAGMITGWNRRARRMFGHEAPEVIGTPLSTLLAERHRAAHQKRMRSFESTEDPHEIGRTVELSALGKDGGEFPIELSISPWGSDSDEYFYSCIILDITERRRAESVLEHERFLLKALMDHVPARIYFKDAQSRFLRSNRAHLELFGLTRPSEAIGKSDFDFFSKEHAQQAFEDEQRVMETGELITLEERETWPDGRVTWVSSSKMPLRDGDGKIVGTFGISHDTTARKRAEEMLRCIIDTVLDGIITIDAAGVMETINPATEQIFGYSVAELEGQNVNILMPPPFHEEHDDYLKNYLASGIAKVIGIGREVKGLRKDGSTFPMDLVISEMVVAGKHMFVGVVRDITARKRAEDDLQSMANRLSLATHAAAIGIWDFNPVNNELIWDEQMFRILGVEPDQFSGTYEAWQATVHPDDLPGEIEKVEMALKGERDFNSEFRIIWPDQSIHHIKAHALVQRDASGKAVHMIGTNWDITEQKNAETELGHTVAELARSNADLAQFASVASHDLQEPLRAVAGCVELLSKGYRDKLGDDADELIQHTLEGTQRMQTLIHDLLEYSRVNSRGKPPQPTVVDEALEFALGNLTVILRERDVEITRDPLPTVNADRTQLPQLFQNLIANGVKFCTEHQPKIHIGAEWKQDRWVFSVGDNGIGIEPQYHERIFALFRRLHTRTDYPGTGIGLAICKRIVERHGGQIWIESEPGRGSTFFFTLTEPTKRNS